MRTCLLNVLSALALLSLPVSASAGFWEILSQGLAETTCSPYDPSKAEAAVQAQLCDCKKEAANPVSQLKLVVKQTSEDNYFALLAQQHAKEATCAASFVDQATADNSEYLANAVSKIQLARVAKQQLIAATQEVAKNPAVTTKACPASMQDLEQDTPEAARASDPSFEACKKVIVARTAYQMILASIPLSENPPMSEVIDHYSNQTKEDTGIALKVKEAYGKLKPRLLRQAETLKTKVKEKGGAGFNRSERHALLANPRINEKLIEQSTPEGRPALTGLACEADQHYGSGADELDKAEAALTLGLFLVPVLVPVRGLSAIGNAAIKAERVGFFSQRTARFLQLSSLVLTSAAAYKDITTACEGKSVGFVSNARATHGECVMPISLESLEQENCALAETLAAIGFASGASGALLAKIAARTAETVPMSKANADTASELGIPQSQVVAKLKQVPMLGSLITSSQEKLATKPGLLGKIIKDQIATPVGLYVVNPTDPEFLLKWATLAPTRAYLVTANAGKKATKGINNVFDAGATAAQRASFLLKKCGVQGAVGLGAGGAIKGIEEALTEENKTLADSARDTMLHSVATGSYFFLTACIRYQTLDKVNQKMPGWLESVGVPKKLSQKGATGILTTLYFGNAALSAKIYGKVVHAEDIVREKMQSKEGPALLIQDVEVGSDGSLLLVQDKKH